MNIGIRDDSLNVVRSLSCCCAIILLIAERGKL